MKLICEESRLLAEEGTFSLEADARGIMLRLEGEEAALLRPETAVDRLDGEQTVPDIPVGTCGFLCVETEHGARAVWRGKSTAWEEKEYVLNVSAHSVEYFVRVRGRGKINTLAYFVGDPSYSACGSDYEFDTGFAPIPTVDGSRQCVFSAEHSFNEFSYLTVPPLFCYVFHVPGIASRLAMGLTAEEGGYQFLSFGYETRDDRSLWINRFWLTADPLGHMESKGDWTSPSIVLFAAPDRMSALSRYAELAAARLPRRKTVSPARFAYGPIACGWTEQAARVTVDRIPSSIQDAACQSIYDEFLKRMAEKDLHPRLLIIDDKWQKEYGTAVPDPAKWPDLSGWIRGVEAAYGCKTMLWFKLWDPEGLPEFMTMDDGHGGRCADPSNPAYRAFLKERLEDLLSEAKTGACGLKLDYAFTQPSGTKAVSHSGQYGPELLLEYLRFIYDTAHEIRPDAVISGSPCHPMFRGTVDHARLHDYYQDLRRAPEEFSFRRDIYHIALPDALIDTDGAGYSSRRDTLRKLLAAPGQGIPDLYCVSPAPSMALTAEDWQKVARSWHDYEEKVDGLFN